MGRNNKINGQMVFADIIGKAGSTPTYESFLNIDQTLNIPETNDLKKIKEVYEIYLEKVKENVNVLSYIEEAVSQIRSKIVLKDEIKLSIQTNYVYARTTFYRRRYEPNDIRVIVGRTDIIGSDIQKLLEDDEIMHKAYNQLMFAMEVEIDQTLSKLKELITINELVS